MVPAEDCRGHLTTQSQLCHTFVPLEAPRPLLQLSLCLQGFGGSGERGLFLRAKCQDQNLYKRHHSAEQPSFRILCSPPSLFFPLHSESPHPGSSLSHFIIKSLGKKAWLLSSQTDTAWRGRDGTTSFGKLALSQSIESCSL